MAEQVSLADTATSKSLPALPKPHFFINTLCCLLGGRLSFIIQKAGLKLRGLCGRRGYYNLYTCWHTEEDLARSHGYLSSSVLKASIIRASTQEAASATGELAEQATTFKWPCDFTHIADSSALWVLVVTVSSLCVSSYPGCGFIVCLLLLVLKQDLTGA